MLQGISYVVSDVYYVSQLRSNLLSVRQLQENGLDVIFKRGVNKTCSIFHPMKGKIDEAVMSTNQMYVLFAESYHKKGEERCFQVDASDKAELWHHRYGHISPYEGSSHLNQK